MYKNRLFCKMQLLLPHKLSLKEIFCFTKNITRYYRYFNTFFRVSTTIRALSYHTRKNLLTTALYPTTMANGPNVDGRM